MASKRPHPNGWLIRWREPSPADPRARVQRSCVCSESEARAEVHREDAERAEQAGALWVPPDRGPRPGRAGVDEAVAALIAEHGLRGVAGHYLKELRTMRERRKGTLNEVRHSLRTFLRWVSRRLGLAPGARVDPGVLSVPLFQDWWTWMLSENRVHVVHVNRGTREYDRVYKGPLKRSSAYKEWTTAVAFWRWAADVDEFAGAVPRCPTERLRKPYKDPDKPVAARRPVTAASWGQAARCVAECADWVQPLAILCYYTGLRVKQARALTWDDLYLDGQFAAQGGGPVLWIGQGKTTAESDGHFVPVHPALVAWLRHRKANPPDPAALSRDLRRTDTAAYKARMAGLAQGRIAWEVGDQNVSLQLCRAWKAAEVPPAVWELRPAHAFRKALRTNVLSNTAEPCSQVWQAAERLIGHVLPGQVDTYQSDLVLMPAMRRLVQSIPAWEEAAQVPERGQVLYLPTAADAEDMEGLG